MNEFEKDEFKKGQKIYLTLVSELEKIDYYGETYISQTLKDDKGRFYKLKKLSFHESDEKIGGRVEVSVSAIYPDFSPKITYSGMPEAQFIELSSFSKAVQSVFNEIVSYSIFSAEFDIENQYKSKNGNWIWTFLRGLKALQDDKIHNHDFDGFRQLQLIQLEVAETIIRSKFLLEFREDKRKRIKDRLDKIIDKCSSIIDLIDKVIDIEEKEQEIEIIKIVDQWPLSDKNNSNLISNYKIHFLFTKIDQFFSNNIIEKILLKVLDFDVQNNNLKIKLNDWATIRRKRIRNEIFYDDVHNPKLRKSLHFHNNTELKHLIALTDFDYHAFCLREDDNYVSVLLKSTLMRFKGYLNNDVQFIKDSISFLYENIGKASLIEDDFHSKQWVQSFNFELSMNYRFLGKNSSSLEETIKFYKSACLYSFKTRSKNQIVDDGFVKYFEMAQAIEEGKPLTEIKSMSKENLIFYGDLMSKQSTRDDILDNPFLSQLLDTFRILKSIKFNNDIEINWGARERMHKLFDYAMEKYAILDDDHKKKEIEGLYNSEIAALVLASNLLGDGKHELLQSQLPKVFSKGIVEVQKFSTNEIDVDSDEYKEIQLINLISKGESQTLEFKGSWDLSIDSFILPKAERKQLENKWWNQSPEVSRAVASMLNANKGGKLYIGVLENKKKYRGKAVREALDERMNCEELKGGVNLLLGIGAEIKAKGWDSDMLIQNINNQLKKDIHNSVIQHCIIKSHTVKDKEIIEINISENSFVRVGWWINDEELPLRENNQINTMRGGTANRWLDEQSKKYQDKKREVLNVAESGSVD